MNTSIVSKTVRALSGAAAATLLCASVASAGPAQFVIVNINPPGVGFNDPTPRAPVGGNTGTTLGQQRLIAFEHAASIWSATLDSNVPIRIRAQFTALGANVLGSAGPIVRFRDFPNAEQAGTWYHVALANKQAGFDLLTLADAQALGIDPAFSDDINANFSSDFNFYLGLDNNHGAQNDLVAVLLHEFGHGLGFSQSASLNTGALLSGFPDTYNRKLFDNSTGLYWPQMTNAERLASATRFGRVVLDSPRVTAAIPSVLSFGSPGRRRLARGHCRTVPVRHRQLRHADWQPERCRSRRRSSGRRRRRRSGHDRWLLDVLERRRDGRQDRADRARYLRICRQGAQCRGGGRRGGDDLQQLANAAIAPPTMADDGGPAVTIPAVSLARSAGLAMIPRWDPASSSRSAST